MTSIEEMRARQADIYHEMQEISAEYQFALLPAEPQARYDALKEEWVDLDKRIAAEEQRRADLAAMARNPENLEPATEPAGQTRTNGGIGQPLTSSTDVYVTHRRNQDLPDNIFDTTAYHGRARSQEHMGRMIHEGARRAIETYDYPHSAARRDAVNTHLERLLRSRENRSGEIAQRILVHGSPLYRAAFWKSITGQPLTRDEQTAFAEGAALEARAMTTSNTGGVTVPVQIDPTVIPTSNGATNPWRTISRIVQTTSHQWQAVTSEGIEASYSAEGATMSDNTPTLVAPAITPERATAFVPFSWEVGQDWTSLESSLAEAIQDSKDVLEATKFAVGTGTNEPKGVLVAAGTVVATAAGALGTTFAVADVYALEANLPSRFEANATWVASKAVFQKIRQFDTDGGADMWVQLADGNPPELIGYPAVKCSTVGTSTIPSTAGATWGILGDFRYFAIVDRIGLSVRIIPDLFGGTAAVHWPTGQSGLVAYWRNSSDVLSSNAFRVGTISAGPS
jgi:HK97 family phage major capsid protein